MSKKQLSDQQVLEVLKCLFEEGLGNSKTAAKVLGRSSRESTVRHIKKVYKKHGNYYGVTLDGIQEEYVVSEKEDNLDELCEHPDWSISNLAKRLRAAQRTNNQLRKVQRDIFDDDQEVPSLEELLNNLSDSITKSPVNKLEYKPENKATPATLEVMISDIQIGKLTRHYNTDICIKAMKKYGEDLLQEISYKSDKFKLEKIIIELLGDLTEDNTKHGVQSAISTDCGLSEQIFLVTKCLWESVLSPLCNLGVEVEVVGIVGNHGSSTHKGMGTFKEGVYGYDYVVFKTLEQFCSIAGFSNVTFNLPEGTFGHTTIYGKHVILEHGYSNNTSEKGMVDQMRKRGAQLKLHPTYWRQADKHHFICYGQGEQICNSAWFGMDEEGIEYAGILGFAAIPSQTLVWHTDEKSTGKSTVKDIVNLQVFYED